MAVLQYAVSRAEVSFMEDGSFETELVGDPEHRPAVSRLEHPSTSRSCIAASSVTSRNILISDLRSGVVLVRICERGPDMTNNR